MMMNESSNPVEIKQHVWERAGLGKAPFRFVGMSAGNTYQACQGAPIQPGGSCDYCAQGIVDWYFIRSADGKEFKVGCDCVRRAHPDYPENASARELRAWARANPEQYKLLVAVREARLSAERTKRDARAKLVKAGVEESLKDDAIRAALSAQPHPYGFKDRETGRELTRLDWAEWMLAHAGASGRAKIAKFIKTIAL